MPAYLTTDFTLIDPADFTKQLKFDTSALTTATLVTLKIPNYFTSQADTIATLKGTNIFTGLNTFTGGISSQGGASFYPLATNQPAADLYTAISQTERVFKVWQTTAGPTYTLVFALNKNGDIDAAFCKIADSTDTTKRMLFDVSGVTTGTDRTLTVPNASGTIALTSDLPTTASGTYTPTRSAETNLDANVTPQQAQYLRVGNTVTVSGRVTAVDPTLTATATSYELTLPVASNLGAVEDLAGVAFCGSIAGMGAEIIGSVANNTAVVRWVASDITSQDWSFHFSYQVI